MGGPLQILIKPASGLCNLRCVYCFYCDEMEKRGTGSYGLMSMETLEAVVRQAFAYAEERVGFLFQGGEPTLCGLPFFERLMEFEKQYNQKGIPVTNSLQTNGYGLTRDWADFFAKHKFLVGVSVDGTKYTHDAFRVTEQGKGSFSSVMRTLELFAERGVEFNILTVVNRRTALAVSKLYAFYKKNGWRYLQFIPCLDPLGEKPGGREYSLIPEDYGTFLCRLFELWYADLRTGRAPYIRQFENYISILMGMPAESCDMRGGCSLQFVVEADGSVYPCDFYVIDEWRLGSFLTDSVPELSETEQAKRFLAGGTGSREACKDCPYRFLCRGGCRRYWDEEGRGNYFCRSYRMLFEAALPRMQEIAENIARQMHAAGRVR
ncbi:MAG: anaerobic sulfatase maturase [Lachnospiraceae bacterium]|nr:anaerobic sulfatase maturase [Lachnospiraceae bacterium]